MRYGIFSDIHANRQAWDAVLADMYDSNVDVPVCLGDIVGYGPCPQEVLNGIKKVTGNFVMGNHDAAACGVLDPAIFNETARAVIGWTAGQLDDGSRTFLSEMPMVITDGELTFVHAEIENPSRFHYIEDEDDAKDNFAHCTHRITFVGHTHDPTIFAENADESVTRHEDIDCVLDPDTRYIINVGSVGEPRNPEDIRARYVIFDSETNELSFRRINFDVEAYRADLQASGLTITPYFLRVIDSYSEAVIMAKKAKLMRDMRPASRDSALRKQGMKRIQLSVEKRPPLRREPTSALDLPSNSKSGLRLSILVLVLAIALVAFIFLGGEIRPPWALSVASVVKEAVAAKPTVPPTPKVIPETPDPKPTIPPVSAELKKLRKNLKNGLLFYVPFDEQATDKAFLDWSGENRHLQARQVKHGIPGKSGNAVHFKKSGLSSAPGPLEVLKQISISFWILADGTQVKKEKPAKIVEISGVGGVLYDDKKLKINLLGAKTAISVNLAPNGQWTHILVVNDGAKTHLFRNGVKKITKARKMPSRKPLPTAAIRIGTGDSRFKVDEVAIWKRVLWNEERLAVFKLGNKGESLVAAP